MAAHRRSRLRRSGRQSVSRRPAEGPHELERVLLSHPAVAEAAVVGLADARYGEIPAAAVVARAPIDEAALMAWSAMRLAPQKRIRAVRIVAAIPRTASGKVLRRLVRDLVR